MTSATLSDEMSRLGASQSSRGYVLSVVFSRPLNRRPGLEICCVVEFCASDEGRDAVMEAFIVKESDIRPGWDLMSSQCETVDPRVLRAALGDQP
jgi:hypothetical protein